MFLDNGYTKEEWKVVTESRKILHLPDLADLVHGRPRAGASSPTRRRSTSRRASRSRPTGPASCSPRSPASSSRTTRRPSTYPLATDAAGTRRDLRRPGPPGSRSIADGRGLAFWVVSDNLRKGAATNAVQIAEALVAPRLGPSAAQPRGAPRTGPPSATARGSRGAGVTHDRAPGVRSTTSPPRSAPAPRCRLHETRTDAVPGEGARTPEVVFVGEGPGFNEDRPGPAVRRSRRRPARRSSSARSAGGRERGLHHERRQVPAARQPRPGARRDRGLRAVPPAPARGPRPGARRDPGPPLDGPVHARASGSPRSTAPSRPIDLRPVPADALVFAMYHPAAALRAPEVERQSYDDVAPDPAAPARGAVAGGASTRRASGRRPAPAPASIADADLGGDAPPGPRRRDRTPHALLTPGTDMASRPSTLRSGSSRSAGSARSARTCTCSSTATTSSSSTAA